MATDSSQIEKVQSISKGVSMRYIIQVLNTDLRDPVVMWEKQGKQSAEPEKIMNFECIEIGVMGWFVVVKHEVDDVCRRRYEQDLKGGIVERLRKTPKQI